MGPPGGCIFVLSGVFTLFQAIGSSIFAIFGCAVFKCYADFPLSTDAKHTANYLLYLTYFKGECDHHPAGHAVATEWTGETDAASWTFYYLLVCGAVNAIWILTSPLLVKYGVKRRRYCERGTWLYYPWIISTVLVLILDITGAIRYAIDISNTLTSYDFRWFVKKEVGPLPVFLDDVTYVPAVVMTLISLRGGVVIINIVLIVAVVKVVRDHRNQVWIWNNYDWAPEVPVCRKCGVQHYRASNLLMSCFWCIPYVEPDHPWGPPMRRCRVCTDQPPPSEWVEYRARSSSPSTDSREQQNDNSECSHEGDSQQYQSASDASIWCLWCIPRKARSPSPISSAPAVQLGDSLDSWGQPKRKCQDSKKSPQPTRHRLGRSRSLNSHLPDLTPQQTSALSVYFFSFYDRLAIMKLPRPQLITTSVSAPVSRYQSPTRESPVQLEYKGQLCDCLGNGIDHDTSGRNTREKEETDSSYVAEQDRRTGQLWLWVDSKLQPYDYPKNRRLGRCQCQQSCTEIPHIQQIRATEDDRFNHYDLTTKLDQIQIRQQSQKQLPSASSDEPNMNSQTKRTCGNVMEDLPEGMEYGDFILEDNEYDPANLRIYKIKRCAARVQKIPCRPERHAWRYYASSVIEKMQRGELVEDITECGNDLRDQILKKNFLKKLREALLMSPGKKCRTTPTPDYTPPGSPRMGLETNEPRTPEKLPSPEETRIQMASSLPTSPMEDSSSSEGYACPHETPKTSSKSNRSPGNSP